MCSGIDHIFCWKGVCKYVLQCCCGVWVVCANLSNSMFVICPLFQKIFAGSQGVLFNQKCFAFFLTPTSS